MLLLVALIQASSCITYTDTQLARYDFSANIGQIFEDTSGNNYHLVNGSSLQEQVQDGLCTERGVFLDNDQYLKSGTDIITHSKLLLPQQFTITSWVLFYEVSGLILGKNPLQFQFYVVADKIGLSTGLEQVQQSLSFTTQGNQYVEWYFLASTVAYGQSEAQVILFKNSVQSQTFTLAEFIDDTTYQLIIGTRDENLKMKGFIYQMIIYQEVVLSSEFQSDTLFTTSGVSCEVYPLQQTDCLGTCKHKQQTMNCQNCGACQTCFSGTYECVECNSCPYLCYTNGLVCVDINTSFCSPYSFDQLLLSCDYNQNVCGQNCLICSSETECKTCQTGYFLDDNFACHTCHQNCQTCSGAEESNCLTCSSSNASLNNQTMLCQCDPGFYQSIAYPLTCSQCDQQCSTCSGSQFTDCLECADPNAQVRSDGRCQCQIGFYRQSYEPLVCSACSSQCTTCVQYNQCTQCPDPNADIQCYLGCTCQEGYYQSAQQPQVCTECHQQCSTCTGGTEFDCQSCEDQNSELNDTTNECQCKQGYYPLSNNPLQCEICHQSCLNCQGPLETDCLTCSDENASIISSLCQCNSGYFQSNNSPHTCSVCYTSCIDCIGVTVNGCIICDEPNAVFNGPEDKCQCNTGFYPSNQDPLVCSQCHQNCYSCSGPLQTDCQVCLYQNTQVNSETSQCTCIAGYYLSSTSPQICSTCHYNCQTCSGGSKNKCLSCWMQNTYFEEHSSLCRCVDGFYQSCADPLVCIACHQNCSTCTASRSNSCIVCSQPNADVDPYTLECVCNGGYYQVSNSPQNCNSCHQECETCTWATEFDCLTCADTFASVNATTTRCQCDPGSYQSGSDPLVCTECHQDCSTCDGPTQYDCLSCVDNNAVFNLECECKNGFYPSSTSPLTCTACHTDCSTCFGGSQNDCLTCSETNSFLNLDTNSCQCLSSHYPSSTDPLVCGECHQECSTCDGPNLTDCLSCADQNAQVDAMNMECQCKAFYYQSSDNPLVCSSCHQNCLTCTGDTQFDCQECVDPNASVNLGTSQCECPSDYWSNTSGSLECIKCYQNCLTCKGPNQTDCLDCGDPNALVSLQSSLCECGSGFYQSSSSPQACSECHQQCLQCRGGTEFDCSQCTVSNAVVSIYTSLCDCDTRFYSVSSDPLECVQCHQDCLECSGPSANDCIECADLNAFIDLNKRECKCKTGYYQESSSPLSCEACHQQCFTCTGETQFDCIECSDSNAEFKGVCQCLQGYYQSENGCQECSSDCQLCTDLQNCMQCKDGYIQRKTSCRCQQPNKLLENSCLNTFQCTGIFFQNQKVGVKCESEIEQFHEDLISFFLDNKPIQKEIQVINSTFVLFKYEYQDQKQVKILLYQYMMDINQHLLRNNTIQIELQLQEENIYFDWQEQIMSYITYSAPVSVLVNVIAGMIFLQDPSVSWTILNSAQVISYLSLLDIQISQILLNFLRSFQLGTFLPNMVVQFWGQSTQEAPQNFQKYGQIHEEFRDLNIFRNTGRQFLILIILFSGLFLGFLAKKLCCFKKIRSFLDRYLINVWIPSFKFWMLVLLDFCLAATLSVWKASKQPTVFFSVIVLILSVLTPLYLSYIIFRERYLASEISQFLQNFYPQFENKSLIGPIYYPAVTFRWIFFCIVIVMFNSWFYLCIISNMVASSAIIYLVLLSKFNNKSTKTIYLISEIDILLTIQLISLLNQDYFEQKRIQQAITIMNISTIFLVTVIIGMQFIYQQCKKKKTKYVVKPEEEKDSLYLKKSTSLDIRYQNPENMIVEDLEYLMVNQIMEFTQIKN